MKLVDCASNCAACQRLSVVTLSGGRWKAKRRLAARVDRLALVDERRVARDHEQLAEAPTQIGRSVA